MKAILAILAVAVLSWVTTLAAPWWTVAVVSAAVCAALSLSPGRGFGIGFLGVATFWFAVGLVTSSANDHLLAGRMAVLFRLPHWSLYLVIAAVVGGLVGGLGGWTGASLRRATGRAV